MKIHKASDGLEIVENGVLYKMSEQRFKKIGHVCSSFKCTGPLIKNPPKSLIFSIRAGIKANP
jgi:hypothetical protein